MEYNRTYHINRGEYLSDALLHAGIKFIPTNCVINKCLPGIGATHFELTSPRRSIIIEPNVPVIESKAKKHEHCLAVMQGVTTEKVAHFLEENRKRNYKLLTTPESFPKIKEAMKQLDIDMYAECFLLFDECEKIIQDVNFRDSIILPMDDFFRFRYKALISATPIIANDHRFDDFYKVLIQPDYDFQLKLNVISTNNITQALSECVQSKREKICIFCNSIDSINSFFRLIPELQNSCTYCSKDGMEKLFLGRRREKSIFINELKRYNFFTSRFFSAVDIDCEPPHVILISDVCGASQSVIDPKTEAIQIAGRFRKGIRSLTHITGIDPELEYQSREEIDNWLNGAEEIYRQWNKLLEASTNDGKRTLLREAIADNSYTRFLNDAKQPEPFIIANYYEEQSVKQLYTDVRLLLNAYQQTKYFKVTHTEKTYDVSDKERLAIQRIISRKDRYEWLLHKFESLEHLKKNADKKIQQRYLQLITSLLASEGDHNLYICYNRFGADRVRELGLKDKAIRDSLGTVHSSVAKHSNKAKAMFARQFEVGKEYTPTEIKSTIGKIYKELNIFNGRGMTAKEVERFAKVEECRRHNNRTFKIIELL
jgi:hypothetical protein